MTRTTLQRYKNKTKALHYIIFYLPFKNYEIPLDLWGFLYCSNLKFKTFWSFWIHKHCVSRYTLKENSGLSKLGNQNFRRIGFNKYPTYILKKKYIYSFRNIDFRIYEVFETVNFELFLIQGNGITKFLIFANSEF